MMQSFKGFRIAARGLIIHENKMLFVSDDGEFWYPPGGKLEYGETLKDCAKREVYEETGLVVEVGFLVHIFEHLDLKDQIHKIHFLFQAEIQSGELSEQWQDAGGVVQYRKFFSQQEIQANKKIVPRFLGEPEWKEPHRQIKPNEVYFGATTVNGFNQEIIESV